MRWTWVDPPRPGEEGPRRDLRRRMDRFWADLLIERDALEDPAGAEARLLATLRLLDPGLGLRLSPHPAGGWVLALSPGDRLARFPLLAELLRRAPALEDWHVGIYLPALSWDEAEAAFHARTGRQLGRLSFTAERGEHAMVDLTVYVPDREDALLAIELLLGEEVLAHWIRRLVVDRPALRVPWRAAPGRPMQDLALAVEGLQAWFRGLLPDRPLVEGDSDMVGERVREWLTFSPPRQDRAPRREDLLVASTIYPSMIRAASQAPERFHSGRFSRCGETFCYLKVEGPDRPGPVFHQREDMEAALDRMLLQKAAGRVLGGGTGLLHSYVDLALADVSEALPLLRRVLREGREGRRVWLLFFDPELAEEWVGVWPPGNAAEPG